MAQQVTESIWHFIGQFHIADLLSLPAHHYSGAPTTSDEDYTAQATRLPREIAELDGHRTVELDDVRLPQFVTTSYRVEFQPPAPEAPRMSLIDPAQLARVVPEPEVRLSSFDAPAGGGATGQAGPKVNASYTDGGTQSIDVQLTQFNALDDDDIAIGRLQDLTDLQAIAADEMDAAAREALDATLAAVARHTPTFVADLTEQAATSGTTRETIALENGAPLPLPDHGAATGTETAPIFVTSGNGQFENGRQTAPDGQSAQQQNEDLLDALRVAANRADSDLVDGLLGDEGVAAPSQDHAEAFTFVPDGLAPAELATGLNATTNLAIINDFNGASASRVVLGDLHVTNAIVQINVHAPVGGSSHDAVSGISASAIGALAAADGLAESITPALMHNEASFLTEPGALVGALGLGGPGTLEWNIDYVNGSVYNVTVIEQTNLTEDSDVAHTQPSASRYIVSTGDNDQLNITQLSDLGNDYELVIVAGDWYDINAIIQVNMLIGDAVAIGSLPESLSNDAAISSIGGQSPNPLTDETRDLVEAIASKDEHFDYGLAIGLPGNGDGVFDVLYISGDYVSANLIFQTNAVIDADSLYAEGSLAPDSGGSQGNALTNVALINDVNSLSAYQYVGGTVYEEATLVEANIFVDETGAAIRTDAGSGTIDPDVIATIAAMSGADDDSSDSQAPSHLLVLDSTSQEDVLGSMLT